MNRIYVRCIIAGIAVVMLTCLVGELRAGLFGRRFGAGGGACVGGMCVAAPEGVSEVGGFSAEVERFGLFGRPRRARVSLGYSAPQAVSSTVPITYGAGGGGCYSSSYAPTSQVYSAPTPMTTGGGGCYSASYTPASQEFSSAPMTAGGGGCYSSSYSSSSQISMVPQYQTVIVPQTQAAPSPQNQLIPQLPSKALPSQEYSPSRSSSKRATNGKGEFHRSIREIQPQVTEIPPTAIIVCSGKCCGGLEDCECGENCVCGSSPGTIKPKKRVQVRFVDYSKMIGKDILRLVDYNSVSEMNKRVRTSMR